MHHTKSQFYTLWIIFGFLIYYALQQYVALLNEAMINAGIFLDMNPGIVKHSQTICYAMVWVVLMFILLRVIRHKSQTFKEINYRSLRYKIVIFTTTALLSRVAVVYISKARRSVLMDYLDRHDASVIEFYNQFYLWKEIPQAVIFITLIVAFFFLTTEAKPDDDRLL